MCLLKLIVIYYLALMLSSRKFLNYIIFYSFSDWMLVPIVVIIFQWFTLVRLILSDLSIQLSPTRDIDSEFHQGMVVRIWNFQINCFGIQQKANPWKRLCCQLILKMAKRAIFQHDICILTMFVVITENVVLVQQEIRAVYADAGQNLTLGD